MKFGQHCVQTVAIRTFTTIRAFRDSHDPLLKSPWTRQLTTPRMVGQAAVQARLVSCPQCLLRRKFACFSSSRPRQSLKSETPYSVRCTLPQTAAGTLPCLFTVSRHWHVVLKDLWLRCPTHIREMFHGCRLATWTPCCPKAPYLHTPSANLLQRARSASPCTSSGIGRRVGSSSPAGVSCDITGLSCCWRLFSGQTGIICKLLPAKKYALLSKMNNLAFMLQALITRELEEAAKTLGDRVRQKDATCEVRAYASAAVQLLDKACCCMLGVCFAWQNCALSHCHTWCICDRIKELHHHDTCSSWLGLFGIHEATYLAGLL